jgi:ABC-2 type transport system ATP-binding protein
MASIDGANLNGAHDADYVIETRDLTKRFGDVLAVDNLALKVRRGEVYGFLGPNGAGKTTTLRMLLGLAKPTAGSISVFGSTPGSPQAIETTGALIESPGFYPSLSGRDNLRVMATHSGASKDRIDTVLEEVGLIDRGSDRFAGYSQGMKQRLGIAAALLKDPQLVILDEPTNGLDPAGMAEMRTFIRGLRGRRTVLLSSHLMHEVEQTCDRVGIIHRGSLIREGTVDELRGVSTIRVVAHPLKGASQLIAAQPLVESVESHNGALRITADPSAAASINQELVRAGFAVSELRTERASLEHVFLNLTGGKEEL